MPPVHPSAAPNSALRFPSPLEPASNKTNIDCARPYGRPARGQVACIRTGSRCRNTCTAGRSEVRTGTSDIVRPFRTWKAAARRTARNGKPRVYRASEARAAQMFPSWPASRQIVFPAFRHCPDNRVGDTSVTRRPPVQACIVSLRSDLYKSAGDEKLPMRAGVPARAVPT